MSDGQIANSRTIVKALFQGGTPKGRMGLYDSIWPDTLRRWVHQGYPITDQKNEFYRYNYLYDNAEAPFYPVDPVQHFGFDICKANGSNDWFDILPKLGAPVVEEETSEWVIRKNGAGASLKYWKHKSGTPEHVAFHMTTRSVWEKEYRASLLAVDEKRLDLKGTKSELEKRKKQGVWTWFDTIGIWENFRQSAGDLCMYEALALDRDWIHDYNRVYTDFFKAHFKLLFDEAGLPDGIMLAEDLAYKNGLFCSARMLEELYFPYYQELVSFFHSFNLPVVLHSCGYVADVLPLVVAAGFDGLNPMEVKAGCDALEFACRYGHQLTFIGGLDVRILESGDKDLVRKEVRRLTGGMKDLGARYVLASDHSISTNVNYEIFKYTVEVFRDHMSY